MKVTQEFVETLICPACRGKVVLKEGGGIKCVACRRVYPVHRYPNGDEIPGMVVEEATVEDEESAPSA